MSPTDFDSLRDGLNLKETLKKFLNFEFIENKTQPNSIMFSVGGTYL